TGDAESCRHGRSVRAGTGVGTWSLHQSQRRAMRSADRVRPLLDTQTTLLCRIRHETKHFLRKMYTVGGHADALSLVSTPVCQAAALRRRSPPGRERGAVTARRDGPGAAPGTGPDAPAEPVASQAVKAQLRL